MVLNRPLKILIFLFLFIQPIVILIAHCPYDNYDDEAVHYYSSAYLYSSPEMKHEIHQTIPFWMEKEPTEGKRQRLSGRLKGAYNYIMSDTLIRLVKYVEPGITYDNRPFGFYSRHIRICFLAMFIFAMCYLLFLGSKSPLGAWPLLIVLNIAAFRVMGWDIPALGNYTFTVYVPRGSAILFVPAILLSYAQDKRSLFVLSSILLFLWHLGFGILVFLAITATLIIVEIVCYILGKARFLKDSFRTKFFLSNAAFLIVTGILPFAIQNTPLEKLGENFTTVGLLSETAARLTGVRYFVLVTLIVFILWYGYERFFKAFFEKKKGKTILAWTGAVCALGLFLYGGFFYRGKNRYRSVYVLRSDFFSEIGSDVRPLPLDAHTLKGLDPGQETVFFYSLGEYLFKKE